jgi:hypothetical protein
LPSSSGSRRRVYSDPDTIGNRYLLVCSQWQWLDRAGLGPVDSFRSEFPLVAAHRKPIEVRPAPRRALAAETRHRNGRFTSATASKTCAHRRATRSRRMTKPPTLPRQRRAGPTPSREVDQAVWNAAHILQHGYSAGIGAGEIRSPRKSRGNERCLFARLAS